MFCMRIRGVLSISCIVVYFLIDKLELKIVVLLCDLFVYVSVNFWVNDVNFCVLGENFFIINLDVLN